MGRDFLLLTTYRSGSTWVMDVLNQLEGVATYAELFHKPMAADRQEAARTQRYLGETLRAYPHYYPDGHSGIRPTAVWRYLSTLYNRPGAVGFKLMYPHLLALPEIWPFVMRRRISVVHLVRQNALDVIISREMRRATQVTHRVAGDDARPQLQLMLDPDWLLGRLRTLQRHVRLARTLLSTTGVRHLELHYEALKQDAGMFTAVADFLGVDAPPQLPQSRLTRLVRSGYRDTLANYDEIAAALAGSEFAIFLEDGSGTQNGTQRTWRSTEETQ